MRWLVLGFAGFVIVGSAQADERLTNDRWPDGPCRDVQQLEALTVKLHKETFGASAKTTQARAFLGLYRRHLLVLLGSHCGVDIQAKMAKDQAAMDADAARRETTTAASQPRGGPPLPSIWLDEPPVPSVSLDDFVTERPQATFNCTTLRLDSELSTTNCN